MLVHLFLQCIGSHHKVGAGGVFEVLVEEANLFNFGELTEENITFLKGLS